MTLVDDDGNSALHYASTNLNYVSTRVLIDAGSPLEILNKDVSVYVCVPQLSWEYEFSVVLSYGDRGRGGAIA